MFNMPTILFNVFDGKSIYTEITGIVNDFTKINKCFEYVLYEKYETK